MFGRQRPEPWLRRFAGFARYRIDPGERRPDFAGQKHIVYFRILAMEDRFDGPILPVAYPTRQPPQSCLFNRPRPIPDALNATADPHMDGFHLAPIRR